MAFRDREVEGLGLMADMKSELALIRNELDTKIAGVTVEQVSMAQAIGSYGERFTAVDARFNAVDARFDAMDMRLDYLSQDMDRRFDAVDRRFDATDRRIDELTETTNRRFDSVDRGFERLEDKLDNRFGWQTVLTGGLALLILFGDTARAALGL